MTSPDPLQSSLRVVNPVLPGSIGQIIGAVAASSQIDLQNCIACRCKGSRLNRNHSTRFIHFLRERMQINDRASAIVTAGRVEYAVPLRRGVVARAQKKSLRGRCHP